MLVIDRQPALGMHEHRAHRPERHIGPIAEPGALAGLPRYGRDRPASAAAGIASLLANASSVGASVNTSARLRR